MNTTIEASQLLRRGLLEGVSVLLAGPASEAGATRGVDESLLGVVGAACAELGAEVAVWEAVGELGRVDVLVVDGASLFTHAGAESSDTGTAATQAPRDALSACLAGAWEATREAVNGAMLASGRAGRIIYLAPAPDVGAYTDGARAGFENLSRTLSTEWARHGITAVTLALGVGSTAGEVAALVAYLASPAGAYFSGCMLDLRGP